MGRTTAMMKANVVDLITVSPEAGGVGTEPTETKRTVYCTVKSIGQQEAYLAMGQGLNPELKVILAHDFEYEGEGLCELEGVRYEILRTYITEVDGIELILQRVARNTGKLPDPEPVTSNTPKGVG
jgi:SPP1 family predicted phage head-tail adaptor